MWTAYLDDCRWPNPVICSSVFQSHKRFKIAMLPETVAGSTLLAQKGSPSIWSSMSLMTVQRTIKPYQVFSKINNYTGKRLAGLQDRGRNGRGCSIRPADCERLGIEDKLYISLGIGEGTEQ